MVLGGQVPLIFFGVYNLLFLFRMLYNMGEMGNSMKLLIESKDKDNLLIDRVDGIILSLEGYSVESHDYYNIDEVEEIVQNKNCLVFVKMNKNFTNSEIDSVRDTLIRLDKIGVDGIFFYDLCVLELKKELNLDIDLIWNQTHMVNNYKTCDYYYNKGVKYALLGKEITLDEIIEIIHSSKISCMVEVVSYPSVAFSKRKLVSNYYKNLKKDVVNPLTVLEKVSDMSYQFVENKDGTSIFLDKIMNGTSIISLLYNCGCPYIIMRGYGIDNFSELVIDTMNYIHDGCKDLKYIDKWKVLGDYTNFFYKKTIYKVK